MNTVLLLIDIQNDYFENGNSLLSHPEKAATNAARLLDLFRTSDLPVIHVQHINLSEGATFFIPNTEGVKINSSVTPISKEPIIKKNTPNSFYKTELKTTLDQLQIEHLVICGMMTHMCIDTTVRAAKDYGYRVTLVQDACTTKDLLGLDGVIPAQTVHNTFIAALNGIFANIIDTKDYAIELISNE
jgi:nicotinamidase-related amidase